MASGSARVAVALLAAAFFVIAAQRLRTIDQVPNRDVLLYSVIAHELLVGRALYSDLWDHKPPLIYVSYAAAEKLVGYGPQQLYLLAVVLSCWVAAMIAWCASRFGMASLVWGVALWVLSWNSASLAGNQPNAELFENALLATAFGVLTSASRFSTGRAVVFGTLIALTTLFKPYAVIYGLLPLALVTDRVWMVKRNLTAIPLCVAAVWIPLISYFVFTNRDQILVDTLWTFNRQYAGNMLRNMAASLFPPVTPVAYPVLAPLVVLALIAMLAQLRRRGFANRPWMLLAGYALITHVAVALPGRFFAHYYQLWLPPLIIAAAWSVASVRRPVLVATAGVFLGALQIHDLRLPQDQWTRLANVLPESVLDAPRLGRDLRRAMPDCEYGLNLGSEVGIYFYGRFRPATGVFYQSHLDDSPLGDELMDRIRRSGRYRPCFLSVDRETIGENTRLQQLVPELTSALQFGRDERFTNSLFDVYVRR